MRWKKSGNALGSVFAFGKCVVYDFKLKRAVFTVEAAFIVPICALIMAALISYMYFMHDTVWSKSAAYEAGFYALQRLCEDETIKEKTAKRLSERYEESILGFAENNTEISVSAAKLSVSWEYEILSEVFGDLFTIDNEIDIRIIKPVDATRLIWAANN